MADGSRTPGRSRLAALAALGGAQLALFVAVAALGDVREPGRTGVFLALALTLGAAHLAATALAWRVEARGRGLVAILALAAAFRATLLAAPPSLSDDVWRYAWEGRVQAAGFDPYRFPPDAEALSTLRDAEVHPRINHPEIAAAYPPGHELVLRAVAEAGGGSLALRVLAALADLATSLLVAVGLRDAGKPLGRVVAHSWCPLSVIEFAGSGHGDSLYLAALVLAVVAAARGARTASALALGASIALRAVPALLLPLFVRPLRWRVVLSLAVVAACVAPYAGSLRTEGAGAGPPLAGAREYAKRWRHNDSAFRALLAVSEARLERIEADGSLEQRERVRDHRDEFNPLAGAKTLAAFLLVVGLGAVVALKRDLPTSILLALFLLLLLSTTVHPWYATWLVPFAALVSRPAPALVFSATSFLAYHVIARGGWTPEDGTIVALEYAPVYAALAWEAARVLGRRRSAGG